MFGERSPRYNRVKSGVTAWAQVNGLRGRTSLADRVRWDTQTILLLTFTAIFRAPGK